MVVESGPPNSALQDDRFAVAAEHPSVGRTIVRLRGDNDEHLVIELSELGPAGTPEEGDLRLDISVLVGRHAAGGHYWVSEDAWAQFLTQVRDLERSRQGQAELSGMSPQSCSLRFAVIDATGHTAVSGFLGSRTPDGALQRLEFGFRFDPGLLPALVGELDAIAE